MSDESRLYGLRGDEELETDIEDVVERVIDDACGPVGEPFGSIADRIAWPLRIGVYRRLELPPADKLAGWVLDDVWERLDAEYGGPDGGYSTPSERVKDAVKALAETVRKEYVPWACEPTGEVIEVTRDEAKAMVGD